MWLGRVLFFLEEDVLTPAVQEDLAVLPEMSDLILARSDASLETLYRAALAMPVLSHPQHFRLLGTHRYRTQAQEANLVEVAARVDDVRRETICTEYLWGKPEWRNDRIW